MDVHVVLTALWWCVKPSTLAPVSLVLGIVLLVYHRRVAGFGMLAVCVVVLLNVTVLPTTQVLSRALERQVAEVAPLPPIVDGIIVLGGDGAERLPPFAKLAARYPDATLVFSGGGEAESAYRFLSRFGDLAERTTYEEHSRNTFENALLGQQLVRPAVDETWVLVTSAGHMARALQMFGKVGWAVIPYPVGFTEEAPPMRGLLDRLTAFEEVCREYLATVAFNLPGVPESSAKSRAGASDGTRE